jgi:nitrite reductase/ring-hydroxylating ferredoxin subunit
MPQWHRVVSAAAVQEGSPHGATVEGVKVGVFRAGDEFYAINNVCTHAYAELTNGFQEGCLVECPLHAGFFDVRTGAGQGSPIEQDVATYPTRLDDGWVYVELP